jgi:hypothetical protein
MIADRGALNSVLKGDYVNGIKKLKSQWASLPATEIKQGYGPKSWKWVNSNLADLTKQYGVDTSTQVAQADKPSAVDKIRDVVSTAISPSTAKADKPPAATTTAPVKPAAPGYYSVGDSHAQGIGGYSNDPKNNIKWNNRGATGASAFDKRHLENIKNIPAGSVVALSMGANDLGSKKLSDIVDQVNKTIAASKAQGHQVVYLLPTASPDPKLQQKREELRQALLKSLESRDILDLGTAPTSKELKGGDNVHLGPEGYKTYGKLITQMFTPGAKTDTAPKANTEPRADAAPKKSDPAYEPGTPEYDARMEKLQIAAGDKFSKERAARLKQQAAPPEAVAPKKSDPAYEPGTPEYDTRMEKLQTAAGYKFSQERTARLEKERQAKQKQKQDQTEPVKTKRELSDFEKEFTKQREKQGAGGTFDWTDPVTRKTGTFTTSYRDEPPVIKTKSTDTDAATVIKTTPSSTSSNTSNKGLTEPSLVQQYIDANLEKLDRLLAKSVKADDSLEGEEKIVDPNKF